MDAYLTVTLTDHGFFIRVLAKGTNLGEQFAPSTPVGPVTGEAPQHGVRVLAEPVDGTVMVREPGQNAFSVLTELSLIPAGSSIDTRGCQVQLTGATGQFGSETLDHPVQFYAGAFKFIQKHANNARATAKLTQKLACGKKKGKQAKASARGTTWLTKDTCKGTTFKVTEGLGITVFDFKKKKIKLGPGDKYFAAN